VVSAGSVWRMSDWPAGDREAVFVTPALVSVPVGFEELRARLAGARAREGLPADDESLSQIMSEGYVSEPERSGIYTASERHDIYGDNERLEAARAVLTGAEDVFGGLQICWCDGHRGIRVLLTGELDRYRRLLSHVIDPERLIVEQVALTEAELARRGHEVRAQSEQLATQGIFVTRSGKRLEGFVIEYLAADFTRAERIMQDRFGDFAKIRYCGATNHTFRPFPFGSWLAEEDRLHVFYGLSRNGERSGGCQVLETETAVVVALMVKDWHGAKTLVGGFRASHETVQLREPLGDRAVIDDAHNRARPHWTQV
jgi:hypothetical protein